MTIRTASLVCAASAMACGVAWADIATYESGRFLSGDREVFQGTFSQSVRIDSLTLGGTTFNAPAGELVAPASVRIAIDRNRDGVYELVSEEQLRIGRSGVALARGRDLQDANLNTALDAMSSFDLARVLYTDGSVPVRVDLLLTAPIYDNDQSSRDRVPEAVLIGSFTSSKVRLNAIIAGNLESPVLGSQSAVFGPDSYILGDTGVVMLAEPARRPQHVAVVGADLSSDLGVREGITAVGYRLYIDAGDEAIFALLGSGAIDQLALGLDEVMRERRAEAGGASPGSLGASGEAGALGSVQRIGGIYTVNATTGLRLGRTKGFSGTGGGASAGFDFGGFDFRDIFDDVEEEDVEEEPDEGDEEAEEPEQRPEEEEEDDPDQRPSDQPKTGDVPGQNNDNPGESEGLLDNPLFGQQDRIFFGMEHDEVVIDGQAVPAPAAGALLVLAGLAGRRRRRA